MLVQRTAMLVGNLPLPTLSSVSFSPLPFVPNDGGGNFNVSYSITNAAGGEYVNLSWSINGASPTTDGPFTSSPVTINTALYTGDIIYATLRLYSATGVLLDTVTLSPYTC